ncbi:MULTISPECIES: hypothetical protein [unclassified Streptomyces]|nr:hypothetical protein [Streptomyces sp. TSRI0281]
MLAVNRVIGYRLVRERLLVETPSAGYHHRRHRTERVTDRDT